MRIVMAMSALAFISLAMSGAQAQTNDIDQATVKLRKCATLRSTGQDRQDIARWFFVVMSSAPQIQDLATTTTAQKEATDRSFARILTRLSTKDCVAEFSAVAKTDLKLAFDQLGEQLGSDAFSELMNDKATMDSLTRYTDYMNADDFKILAPAIDQSKKR